MRLTNKLAIVTGAASGIGRAIALALARELETCGDTFRRNTAILLRETGSSQHSLAENTEVSGNG